MKIKPSDPPRDKPDPHNRATESLLQPLAAPYKVAIDTREQTPWPFAGLRWDSRKKYRPAKITCERVTLSTGDYSIVGCESEITIERKSLSDLCSTLAGETGSGGRFAREHERMREMVAGGGRALVVIEAPPPTVVEDERYGVSLTSQDVAAESLLDPSSLLGYWLSWQCRYGIPWVWAGGRREAEIFAWKMLDHWWGQWKAGKKHVF